MKRVANFVDYEFSSANAPRLLPPLEAPVSIEAMVSRRGSWGKLDPQKRRPTF